MCACVCVYWDPRKYWEHWSKVASWAANHPGRRSTALPVFIYGDEAKYSNTHGDKFIALVLGSPLVFKKRTLECQ